MTPPSSPLSLAHDSQLNSAPSLTKRKYEYHDDYDMIPSSPRNGSSGHSASASRSDRNLQTTPSRGSTARRRGYALDDQENTSVEHARSLSPRKTGPESRFPVMTENEGLRRAIQMFEDEQSALEREVDGPTADESIVSTLSTFSAVPSSAMLARLAHTPSKLSGLGSASPRARADTSPNKSSVLRPRTSRLDLMAGRPAAAKAASPPPARPTPRIRPTPSRQQLGSLDSAIEFDGPPMPTPRSVPTITPRELESLKSQFLSEISSLKASLSGKEAEVRSLKSAVGDAEKRVGQSLERLREERALKEQLAAEKEDWETRGREMEGMLGRMREEMRASQREKEELERQLEESEKKKEAAEMMQQEAETKLGSLRGSRSSNSSSSNSSGGSGGSGGKPPLAERSRPSSGASAGGPREVEMAVERVARELHALYKSKHETKVAALKKSYEGRWEKKVLALETRVEELSGENERLRQRAEAGPDPDVTIARLEEQDAAERTAQAVRDSAAITELTADAQRLEAVVASLQRDNEELRRMLQQERVEKGELVQLAEELMGIQQQTLVGGTSPQGQSQAQSQAQARTQARAPPPQPLQDRDEDLPPPKAAPKPASQAARSSGLRAPGTSGLRAPTATKIASASSSSSSVGGLPRPGARGGIVGSIERMGSQRGRGE